MGITELSDFEVKEIAYEVFKKHYKDRFGKYPSAVILHQYIFAIEAMLEFGDKVAKGELE